MAQIPQKIKGLLIYAAIIFGISIICIGLISLTAYKKGFLKLGVVTTTGTFPTALNNFQDNDIINAGDWNHIEYAIGETGTTSPATLTYQVTNTNANNLTYSGHLTITSASTTDQTITNLYFTSALGVGSGGSGAASLSGFLYGNGTSAFTATSSPWFATAYINNLGATTTMNGFSVCTSGNGVCDSSSGVTSLNNQTGALTFTGFSYASTTSYFTGTTTPYFATGFSAGATSTMNNSNICTANNGACGSGTGGAAVPAWVSEGTMTWAGVGGDQRVAFTNTNASAFMMIIELKGSTNFTLFMDVNDTNTATYGTTLINTAGVFSAAATTTSFELVDRTDYGVSGVIYINRGNHAQGPS